MTAAARHLRVIDGNGEILDASSPEETIHALQAALTRAQRTIDGLRADKTRERRSYEQRAVIEDAFHDWQRKLVAAGLKGKARCKLSDDRFDAMKALVDAGYTLEDFELVNTGIAACQFVVYGKRRSSGPADSRNVDLEYVCSKARRFEEAAQIGHQVMKARGDRMSVIERWDIQVYGVDPETRRWVGRVGYSSVGTDRRQQRRRLVFVEDMVPPATQRQGGRRGSAQLRATRPDRINARHGRPMRCASRGVTRSLRDPRPRA